MARQGFSKAVPSSNWLLQLPRSSRNGQNIALARAAVCRGWESEKWLHNSVGSRLCPFLDRMDRLFQNINQP